MDRYFCCSCNIHVAALTFADSFFTKTYTFKFTDADRSQPVQNEVEIKVLKVGESPLPTE